jgi:hypothetical protein
MYNTIHRVKLRMRTRDSTYISNLQVALDCFDCDNTVVDIVMKKTPSKLKVFRLSFKVAIFYDCFLTKIIFVDNLLRAYCYLLS